MPPLHIFKQNYGNNSQVFPDQVMYCGQRFADREPSLLILNNYYLDTAGFEAIKKNPFVCVECVRKLVEEQQRTPIDTTEGGEYVPDR